MRTIFVGGPGRSGTSFVARQLGTHPEVCTLPDVELKFICEKNGLIDLHHTLCEEYSPNRATVALEQFRRTFEGLVEGRFGQPAFRDVAPARAWRDAIEGFLACIRVDGHPVALDSGRFLAAAHGLIQDVAAIAAGLQQDGDAAPPSCFLEKTPHALLSILFLDALAPGSAYLHVMRDPRSIAFSLRRMRWGPERLETCCRWVASYCEAWERTRRKAAAAGLPVLELRIEEVAADGRFWSAEVSAHLGIAADRAFLAPADAATLNGWVARATAAERDLLDAMLGDCAASFGYARGEIGQPGATLAETA